MDKFIGTFKWDKDENVEQALTAIGAPENIRNMLVNARPTRVIKDNGGGNYTIETQMADKKITVNFKLGQETEVETPMGKHKVTVTLDGNKLCEKRNPPLVAGKDVHPYMVREGDYLIMTFAAPGGVTGKRYFKKQ